MAERGAVERDRVGLITGGSGGIGRATARRLARDGMAIAVHYLGGRDRAEETVEEITAVGGSARAVGGDVANERSMAEVFDDVEQIFGGVDVVVHTAGINALSPMTDLELEEFDRIVRANLRGTFVVDKLAAGRVRDGGAIINLSTSVVKLAQPGYAAYAATKGAVEAMTLILARELRGRDVTVNAVAPGPTATQFFFEGKSQELIDSIASANPMERLGKPEDIAETVAFLAGPGHWVNGQNLYANGGAI